MAPEILLPLLRDPQTFRGCCTGAQRRVPCLVDGVVCVPRQSKGSFKSPAWDAH